jgi:endonuclease/exonuclease/phosphatase (EEP) superfamily protein YafD
MIKVPLLRHQRDYKSIPTHSTTNDIMCQGKNVNFDTLDVHVMVNYIEPNLQEIIFTLSTVSLITQKQFWDHLKNWHFLGYPLSNLNTAKVLTPPLSTTENKNTRFCERMIHIQQLIKTSIPGF